MYHPIVLNSSPRIQTKPTPLQTPFYFGGSQVPHTLNLSDFNGSGIEGTPSKTDIGTLDHNKDKVYHQRGQYVIKPFNKPYVKSFV